MANSVPVHVVSKLDSTQHAVCQVPDEHPALAASSVRVKTSLISLSSNNLTYASAGALLHWWDVFPVPPSAPAPFANRNEWGIVPAWGYARVVDSTIDDISIGTLLWGMWPTSAHAVDLLLRPSEPAGCWTEFSKHREQVMTVYNSYRVATPLAPRRMHTTAMCRSLWIGPNLLNKNVFLQNMHPLGMGGEWSEADADLSASVVVSLSASSKTGRSFTWELARNRDVKAHGPLGLLQFTSAKSVNALVDYADSALPIKTASYDDLDSVTWAEQFKPSRIVIVNFGVSREVLAAVVSSADKIAKNVTVIAVGNEAKIYTADELAANWAGGGFPMVPLNTSPLQDQVIMATGAAEYAKLSEGSWNRCLEDDTFGGLEIKVLRAVEGEQGIEGAWDDLCRGTVKRNAGIVVDLTAEQ